jgi:hypothetical protein
VVSDSSVDGALPAVMVDKPRSSFSSAVPKTCSGDKIWWRKVFQII